MPDWKKVGKAYATGGASLAYDKAKQRREEQALGESLPEPEKEEDETPSGDDIRWPSSVAASEEVAAELSKLKQRAKRQLAQNLSSGESVQIVINGAHSQALVATGSRVFVVKVGFMAGATLGAEITSWSYRNLVGVQVHKGMFTGAVVLQAPGQGGGKTSYWGQKDDDPAKAPNAIPIAGGWEEVQAGVAKLRALIDQAQAPTSAAQPAGPTSVADELHKLAGLKEAGVLSEQEFDAAKGRLLGG